ncbi:MAG: DUF465 domain-containing protein [Pseudomonadota bacterium]
MALDAHVAELRTKHQALSRRIEEAYLHPSFDELTISQLKREKLRLKDQMNKLQQAPN